jgi:hypothetical protein
VQSAAFCFGGPGSLRLQTLILGDRAPECSQPDIFEQKPIQSTTKAPRISQIFAGGKAICAIHGACILGDRASRGRELKPTGVSLLQIPAFLSL